MKFAFTTPEFVTDLSDSGGLGNYLDKITKELCDLGHSCHLFVSSNRTPRQLQHGNVTVSRVPRNEAKRRFRIAYRILNKLGRFRHLQESLSLQISASAMAEAIRQAESREAFDVIQSADYFATGLMLPRNSKRVHIVRCSWAIDLYKKADGYHPRDYSALQKLEFTQIRNADAVYSPSQFTADHYSHLLGRKIDVIRPPASLGVDKANELPFGLPPRFLVHYGQLNNRKGFNWMVRALRIAFEADSSLRVVIVGSAYPETLTDATTELSKHRDKFVVLYPLAKPQLMKVVSEAVGSILPSLVDNLPNTVIESLVLGTPVIGSLGASIDEIVDDKINGRLAPINDDHALAQAILEVWQGKHGLTKPVTISHNVANALTPRNAAQNLVDYCEHVKSSARNRNNS
jgi:glycosyltransferase involved in cell wall biosynthesis